MNNRVLGQGVDPGRGREVEIARLGQADVRVLAVDVGGSPARGPSLDALLVLMAHRVPLRLRTHIPTPALRTSHFPDPPPASPKSSRW